MKKLLLLAGFIVSYGFSFGQCSIIYVSTAGTASATGDISDPLDLTTAFTVASQGELIRIATGTYTIDNPLNIPFDDIIIEGGFDDFNGWKKTSLAGATTINRSALNPQGSQNQSRLIAMYAIGITGFELHDITLTTDNASSAGTSTYGMHIENCANYSIVRCQLMPGNGGAGAVGSNGSAGSSGAQGQNGFAGSVDGNCNGGTGGYGGAGGGTGAGGSTSGAVNPGGCNQTGTNGGTGANASNTRAGHGGGSGASGGETDSNGGHGGNGGGGQTGWGNGGNWGDPGGDGGNGTSGASGGAGNTGTTGTGGQLNQFFTPGIQAGTGTDGIGGKGGCGGGGGGGQSCTFCDDGSGNGAGGGGGGGEGGTGGTGGFGGGSSFGIYLFNNGLNGTINNCLIIAGNSGNGGNGGNGGSGGTGGIRGFGQTAGSNEIGEGGDGGNGGNGGTGGTGGTGSDGLAADIQLTSGDTLIMSDVSFDLASLPEITVDYLTCTSDYASFKDETLPVGTGNTLWNFGTAASNQFGTDNPSSTSFTSVGMFDIAQGSNVYTDFVYITCTADASATQTGSTITANNTAAASYQWVDCNTGFFPISGETSQSFTATSSGDYAVIVSDNSCSDTSACFNVDLTGIDALNYDFLNIYPNPVRNIMTIELGYSIPNGSIRITDMAGKLIDEITLKNDLKLHYNFTAPNGIYLVELHSNEMHSVHRIVKN